MPETSKTSTPWLQKSQHTAQNSLETAPRFCPCSHVRKVATPPLPYASFTSGLCTLISIHSQGFLCHCATSFQQSLAFLVYYVMHSMELVKGNAMIPNQRPDKIAFFKRDGENIRSALAKWSNDRMCTGRKLIRGLPRNIT